MRPAHRFSAAVVLLALGAVGVAGCSGPDDEEATRELAELLAVRSEMIDGFGGPETVGEAMPREDVNEFRDAPLSPELADFRGSASLVVLGHVTEVKPIAAYGSTDVFATAPLSFEDENAAWGYARVTIEVERVVASADDSFSGEEVHVLVVVPHNKGIDFTERAYRGLGDAVFFLVPSTTWQRAPYRLLGDMGDWIFTVDGNGVPDGVPLAQPSLRDPARLKELQEILEDA